MAQHHAKSGIDRAGFAKLAGDYGRRWGAGLCATMPDGSIVFDSGPCGRCAAACEPECAEARAFAISEGLRWGEASMTVCPARRMLWAVPLMCNNEVLGGLIANATEERVLYGEDDLPPLDIPRACSELRALAEEANLTNAAALAESRRRYHDEQQRAHAIHAFKSGLHYSIRELYMREEPALLAAIRSGDRRAAREILNRLLMTVHYHARDRLDVVRSIFLELVVTMSRTAVEAGAEPEESLGINYRSMAEASAISSHEELAAWLRQMLEGIMDAIERHRRKDPGFLLFEALEFMRERCCESISRDDVAAAAHISPSHFSALIRRESGSTFTDLLNRMRVDRAAEMLARTDKPLATIALECGFRDQSYFTKVFKRYRNTTPLRYRRGAGE
ncbi:MAG: helix-turn-helix transcriptional regulator [candidate division WS1 bacterium]|nr:helix-turn-helix transcriptional regulator [candidate division WS1 bacterium]